MARPIKQGVDYFPLDVRLDEKIELIEAEFGLQGFGVIVKLFQNIYGGRGYYIEWTDEVALLFAKKVGLGGNVVSEIVSASIRRGIFDENLFAKYQVLTSEGIQKRYFEIVTRRKDLEVDERYLLVSCTQKSENVDNNRVNVCNNSVNVCNNSQSKEKKSKEKKSILKENIQKKSYPLKVAIIDDRPIEEAMAEEEGLSLEFYETMARMHPNNQYWEQQLKIHKGELL